MTAATAPAQALVRGDHETSVAARMCWHAVEICRALDRGVGELQAAIAEAAKHTDALIELALALTDAEPAPQGDACGAVVGVPQRIASLQVEGARA